MLVTLKVYSSTGRLVRRLLEREIYGEGSYSFVFNGRDDLGIFLPGGVYFLRAQIDRKFYTEKFVLLRRR